MVAGDILHINPRKKIPADGAIQEILSYLDESVRTGAIELNHKEISDKIFGGTFSDGSSIEI